MSGQSLTVGDLPPAMRDSPVHTLWMSRIANGRDLRAIITADNAATGVGKTTLAVHLAQLWDIWGFSAGKATLDPREYSVLYDRARPGSVMILDEAEQAIDARRSMSTETLKVGHDFATKRYQQIVGLLTLPSKDMMDKRIADKLCDLWFLVTEPGTADVYRFDANAFSGQTYYKRIERYSWPPLDDDATFQRIEQKKDERMRGDTQSAFVHRDEVEAEKETYWEKAEARTTYELINEAYALAQDASTSVELSQAEIGEMAGIDQSTVSKTTNTDLENYYSLFATRGADWSTTIRVD